MHSHRERPQEAGSFTLALVSDSCGGRYERCQNTRLDACLYQEVGGTWAMEGWGVSQILGGGAGRPCNWEAWRQKDLGSDFRTVPF